MTPERVPQDRPLVLDQRQRERYVALPPPWDQVGYRSIFSAQAYAD